MSNETRSLSRYVYGINISEGKSRLRNSYGKGQGGRVLVNSSS